MRDKYRGGYVIDGVRKVLFTKLNDDEIIGSNGTIINVSEFVQMCEELSKFPMYSGVELFRDNLYDDFLLCILRHVGILPCIRKKKKPLWSTYNYETDEATVRRMGLMRKF